VVGWSIVAPRPASTWRARRASLLACDYAADGRYAEINNSTLTGGLAAQTLSDACLPYLAGEA
jgi:hypothetical protein